MSLQMLKDENISGDKTTENRDFLFSPPELTGRSSAFRLSQKENVPPKSIAKAMKVTFQTPLRDPQTHRILSPSVTSKPEIPFTVDDTAGLENFHPIWTQKDSQQLTREVDTKAADGTLQKPATANAAPAPGSGRPAGDSSTNGPGFVLLGHVDSSSSPQAPGSCKSPPLPPGQMPGSPKEALEENASSYSLDKNITFDPENLEDFAGTAALDKMEGTHEATKELLDSGVSAALTEAASPPTRSPEGPCGEVPLADLPGVAPACSKDTCAPQEDEQKLLASTMGDAEASGAPVPLDEAQALAPAHASGLVDTAPASPSRAERAVTLSPQKEEGPRQMADSAKSEPIKLEFDFSDNVASKRAPPPRKLGKRPGIKPPSKSREARQAPTETGKRSVSAARGSYNLDWDKLDDPNFNPFGNGSSCGGGEAQPLERPEARPTCSVAEPLSAEASPPSQQVGSALPDGSPEVQVPAEAPGAAVDKEGKSCYLDASVPTVSLGSEPTTTPAEPTPSLDLTKESFRDPAEVLGTGAEVDYLEQFGASSFKESALRKQSLYLKFDPLLKDSPNRLVPVATQTSREAAQAAAGPAPLSLSTQAAGAPSSGSLSEARLVEFDFLGSLDVPVPSPPACVLGPGGPPLQVGPIVDVLRYSQQDLDAAVKTLQMENLELKSRCEELYAKNQEMGKIMDEFEGIARQVTEEAKKEKELAEAKIQKVLKERDQLTTDLNSMEKSFSDLFKRLEKQKEVIEGYHKNEESLKKCVEDYILRIEKESQRYQALKAHAEEKLTLANEEITQVRSKAQAEALAFQASLRKEQMRVHSLEKTIEQKTKENEELTRICDDLISKMEKI
ncbi:transforming acidic coiled-coil-containing protein 3 isoform X1 [Elephas maximus indicus]|uniref:transforming acidic coiled-coil-containing protein 3 isoform X1 n=1 Tax=Elephas maximus indicus TaxID=99487 RepID=UPI002116E3A3|nr:transforming acidic coiled-coil-containing protein 3 isoform X1 [Elephas maximus indicus]XP_049742535.1 transforming acidic coiled-coil-containing protein 3 isoform X1 [Elephas maximus indicus]